MTTGRLTRAGSALSAGVLVAMAAGTVVTAHRLDEYLQAARIDVQPAGVRIELALTPGAAAAESIITMIDRDRDGSTSSGEQHAYAADVVKALEVAVDGWALPLRIESEVFPDLPAFRRGDGTIRLEASATHPTLSAGKHELFFSNKHLASQSVYLANVLVPDSPHVAVMDQRRDGDQRELTIEYSVGGAPAGKMPVWWLLGLAGAGIAVLFTRRRG